MTADLIPVDHGPKRKALRRDTTRHAYDQWIRLGTADAYTELLAKLEIGNQQWGAE